MNIRLPEGTLIRSKGWRKSYGYIIGWERALALNLVRWNGGSDYGPEAVEDSEIEIPPPTSGDTSKVYPYILHRIDMLEQEIMVEQIVDNRRRGEYYDIRRGRTSMDNDHYIGYLPMPNDGLL